MEMIRRFADLGIRPVGLKDLIKICPQKTNLPSLVNIWDLLGRNSIYLVASATFYDPFNSGLRVIAEADENSLLKIASGNLKVYPDGLKSFYQMQRRGFVRRNASSVRHDPDLLRLELDFRDSSGTLGAKVGPRRDYSQYDTSPGWENAVRIFEGN